MSADSRSVHFSARSCRLRIVSKHVATSRASRRSISLDVPTRLWWALAIVVLFHGGLLLSGTFRGTYDAYVHIFLGDHYERDWFSTWDQRWYTGFTTVSYPPGTHMSIAGLTKLTGSLEVSFVIVQLSALLLLTVGVFRFSRLWVDDDAAANAALLLVVSSSIAETVHLFGQLPTTFALAFLLNALPSIRKWVFGGRFVDLLVGTVVLAACTAGHHVTTLFGSVFFLGPVLAAGLLEQSRVPRVDEPFSVDPPIGGRTLVPLIARRIRRVLPATIRVGVLAPCLLGVLIIVVLPYWIWSGSDPINQIPIPHGSRGNFLADLNLGMVFFFIPWGLLLLVLPYALVRAVVDRMWPLAASIFLLFVLGTGGTTPIPKALLGPAFDILTLDRFTFWATIQILPLAGLFVKSLESGTIAQWLRGTGGRLLHRSVFVGFIGATLTLCLFASTLSRFRSFQPDPIDPDPIVAFIEKDQHERWRFLTLGFGDQMAWLSAQTTATQVDGNYHSVRRLPELTSTSVERLEGAKYRGISGLGSLQQFLEVPEKYHLKFVFSNDAFYDPLLHFLGWQELGPLENGIVVWEKNDIEPLPAVLPVRELPVWQRFMWGTVPPTMIVSALFLLSWSLLGRPGFRRRGDAPLSMLVGPFAVVDRKLRRPLPEVESSTELSEPVEPAIRPGLARLRRRFGRPASGRRRALRLAALVIVVGALPVRSALQVSADPEPPDVVEAYYEHLDFRRWRAAYDLLDPETRPDFELWRLQISVNGGILASYAKLDSMAASVGEPPPGTPLSSNEMVVDVDLQYLTALDWYPVARQHVMVNREDSWFLVPDAVDLTVPPDQLVRRTNVDYLIQGRRRVTSLTSELADIQDRPEVDLREVRLVESEGLPVVVGEIVNVDVDPADLTITAVLRDADGNQLARYNATDHLMRTLNPRESSPFRIDFEEVAAGTDVDFDPLDFSPIQLDDDVASVEVYAKAVVTQQGLYRGLQVNSLELVGADQSWMLEGEIRNDGVVEAVVPMVLVSYLDDAGDVMWVERTFLDTAIRSQRSDEFQIELSSLAGIAESAVEVSVFANGPGSIETAGEPSNGVIEAPPGMPYAAVQVDVVSMLPTGAGP